MIKRRERGLMAGIIILVIISAALLLIVTLPIFKNSIQYDNSNTTEHSATVKDVMSNDKGYEIHVNEFSCTLAFSTEEVIDINSLQELHNGEEITFNIPKFYDEALTDNEISSLWIVSLKTANADIVTFESHCNKEMKDYRKSQITAAVFSGICLCGAIVCLVFLIKSKKANMNVVN